MSIYLAKLKEARDHLNEIVEELDTTHAGQKYVSRLYEILEEMDAELGVEEDEE